MSDYQPIACHLHDEFEIAIMRAQRINVELVEDGRWLAAAILPVDTNVTDGEEFLVYKDATGAEHQVRLDRVRFVD